MRRTEDRKRNRATKAPGRPPARGWRSRDRRAEPRQHWGTDEKSPTGKGWALGRWWRNTEPNPRPQSDPDSNALALRAWIRRFGQMCLVIVQTVIAGTSSSCRPRSSSGYLHEQGTKLGHCVGGVVGQRGKADLLSVIKAPWAALLGIGRTRF